MVFAILHGKRRNDYVNFRGENVSKMWRDINRRVPENPGRLKRSSFSFFPDSCRAGSYGEFYSLGNSMGGKRLNFSNYNGLRQEFMKYELAERLEKGILPEKYGIMLVRNEENNKDVPMIVSKDLGNMLLSSNFIDGKYFEHEANKKFKEKVERISKHLKYFEDVDFSKVKTYNIESECRVAFDCNDIDKHNAIYSVEDMDTYLIDPAFWCFKGVQRQNVF